ncbi:hypothetical protein HIM_11715 [Hirsutella minnesotensis 3608]|uniref:Zn(2)-C6 fungal-type domain-containing protein n=1 Tax=Hirsutella minnesotensis 3608 TaxID=1043627 RepID=A0A0F7ZR29_9HYPO|nr:hypothetical protein HIM_11715 [Hirsutella minnesotensis 3608]
MKRHYVPIRPSNPVYEERELERGDVSAPLEPKRRRVGVSVACNECRRKRIRCDGQKPVCTNCRGKIESCQYRDKSGMSPETKGHVVEVVQALCQLPVSDAIQMLDKVRHETDALRIMSTLREQTALLSKERSSRAQELQSQNPTAYPWNFPLGTLTVSRGSRSKKSTPDSQNAPESTKDSASKHIESLDQGKAHEKWHEPDLCDPRLRSVHIARWSNVGIDNLLAVRCISLYLVTDHPLLGHFDPELFISDLVSGRREFCSSLLVNALLYWACVRAMDERTDELALRFCAEAESLWQDERTNGNDSVLTLAAAEFLSLGYLGQGKDHSVLKYLKEAADMGARMGLFTVEGQVLSGACQSMPISEPRIPQMYAAWGIFNWLTLMSFFYHQPGIICPTGSPRLPIPIAVSLDVSRMPLAHDTERVPSPSFMGNTFTYACLLWDIVREVSWVYHAKGDLPWGSRSSLAFAEFKFRELLAWSNGLPSQMESKETNPHHVHVLHLWLHAAILDIFRPFMRDAALMERRLKTFARTTTTPRTVCDISTSQLKGLIISYRVTYASSSYSILWHTALIYVVNELLETMKEENWQSYLLLCLYGYERLSRSWRVARAITKGLLSMALRRGGISSGVAIRVLNALGHSSSDQLLGGIRATFMLDLARARVEPTTGGYRRGFWVRDRRMTPQMTAQPVISRISR